MAAKLPTPALKSLVTLSLLSEIWAPLFYSLYNDKSFLHVSVESWTLVSGQSVSHEVKKSVFITYVLPHISPVLRPNNMSLFVNDSSCTQQRLFIFYPINAFLILWHQGCMKNKKCVVTVGPHDSWWKIFAGFDAWLRLKHLHRGDLRSLLVDRKHGTAVWGSVSGHFAMQTRGIKPATCR